MHEARLPASLSRLITQQWQTGITTQPNPYTSASKCTYTNSHTNNTWAHFVCLERDATKTRESKPPQKKKTHEDQPLTSEIMLKKCIINIQLRVGSHNSHSISMLTLMGSCTIANVFYTSSHLRTQMVEVAVQDWIPKLLKGIRSQWSWHEQGHGQFLRCDLLNLLLIFFSVLFNIWW